VRHSTQRRERLRTDTRVLLSANSECLEVMLRWVATCMPAQGLTWSVSCLMLGACVTALFASKLALCTDATQQCQNE
jgi:hypothetical protein